MILYLDTSALVKVYINEDASEYVKASLSAYDVIASHMIAFVEAHSAFARLHREQKITEITFTNVKNEFVLEWSNYMQIDMLPSIVKHACDLTETFALRAYDSLHLAAAHWLLLENQKAVTFACFDNKLNRAAAILGLNLLNK
ncbi:type II toxin-antitoxin system VapC family toxin [soil metagenome]